MRRNTITVTATQLEQWAAEAGLTITMRPDHGELRIGSKVFVAPLSIPTQREGS